ncbi:MAG: hypothetical protein ACRDF4_10700, partial [Rhabdochlamydiaceae bacterium]
MRKLIYERHSLDASLKDNLSIDDLSVLLDAYIGSILFRTIVLHRPLLAYVGPWGSGKTEMQRYIGICFFGKNFDVLGLQEAKQDAAIAYVTSSTYGVFDNADERIKWLPDLLARISTGQRIPLRKLYTTNELVKHKADCVLGLTARTTPWARPDIISRLLLVKFKQPPEGKYVDEKKHRQAIIDNRQSLISEILVKAKNAIKRLKDTDGKDYDSPTRLAGFYSFGIRINENTESFVSAFNKALLLQNSLAAEEEEVLVTILRKWIDAEKGSKDVQGALLEWTKEVTTAELYAQLVQVAKNENIELGIKTAPVLGRRIKENEAMLQVEGILFQSK